MRKLLAAALFFLGFSGLAVGQVPGSAVGSGFALGVSTGLLTTGSGYSDANLSIDALGRSVSVSSVTADYTFRGLGPGAMILGADYDLTNPRLASFRDTTTNFSIKQDRRWGLYLAPGMLLTPNAIAYLKVAHHWLDLVGQGDRSGQSYQFKGWTYGLGTRIFIDRNIYLSLEWLQSDYGAEAIPGSARLAPEGTYGLLGVGIRFP